VIFHIPPTFDAPVKRDTIGISPYFAQKNWTTSTNPTKQFPVDFQDTF